MSKLLKLNLNAAEIKQAVKSDSYITGLIDKSADMSKNAALAFNEQAGDDQYHETKLYRTMKGAIAKFESQIAEYVETSNVNASVTDTLAGRDTTSFQILLTVGDRTSGAFVNTMAYLAQEYIINTMLYYWWQPIKPALAKDYIAFAADNLVDIRRCLAKSAPDPSATYEDVSGKVLSQSLLNFPLNGYDAQMGVAFTTPGLSKYPSDITVTYASSDTDVATIDETTGEITLVGTGDTVITASFEGDDDYAPSSASFTLHVAAGQSSLSFPNSEYNAQVGVAFTAPELSKFPEDATVTYASSDTAVAAVDENTGAITLVSAGDTVITASFAGNDDYNPSTASYTLHVTV